MALFSLFQFNYIASNCLFIYQRINNKLKFFYIYMEDISHFPPWEPQRIVSHLKQSPLTIKNLKVKLDKIYMITSYNQREYLNDVIDAYAWIKLVAEYPNPEQFLQNDKTLKFFIEQFVFTAVKYMELCRTFKLLDMMIYTQQMMVEGLRLFMRYFDQLEKYPRMTLILKHIFDIEKHFFKHNYTNQYHNLVQIPSKELIEKTNSFISTLKTGDRVDVLKTEHHSKRVCWLPATFIKASSLYIYVKCDNQRANTNLQLNTLQVRPYESMKEYYQWRLNLKVGDKVDFMKDTNVWVESQIVEIQDTQQIGQKGKFIEVKVKDDDQYWISLSDSKIQKHRSITRIRPDNRKEQQFPYEDYVDYILDPQMTQPFVTRYQTSKSLLIVDLLAYAHKQLHLFEKIAKIVKEKSMKIEVVADLINFIYIIHSLFHRKLAVEYLSSFIQSILDFINNGKQGTIRNFSKQRYQAVMNAIQQFMKRLLPVAERKLTIQNLQLDLILRFLFSDFLDRKLQAVSLLTYFFKMSKHNISGKSFKQFAKWVAENKILTAIYNQKSHSELISKSSDFLKYYLQTNPSIQQLQPLLIWNDAIIKLVAENLEELPTQIQNTIIEKIKSKSNVTNPDALAIIKKTPNCESWLLQNGGQCWVEVVKEKTRRKPDIAEVFKQPFPIVNKITKQMNAQFESNFKSTYFSYMFEINYLCHVLENDQINLSEKLQFITLATQLIRKISDQVFNLLLKFMVTSSSDEKLSERFQKFFVSIMHKLHFTHFQSILQTKFKEREQLESLTETQFVIFQKCFVGINDYIEQERYPETFASGKKIITKHYALKTNIQNLSGLEKLQEIIFYSKNAEISKRAIRFIGQLLSSLRGNLKAEGQSYITKLLSMAQNELYEISESVQNVSGQQKYLQVIEQLLNQTEKQGIDQTPSVNSLFPEQKLQIRMIDNFNTTRSKHSLVVPSNMTLFEFRCQICKLINAYRNETKISTNGKQLSDRYNGHVVHILQFNSDIVIGRIKETPKVSLLDPQGRLVEKAKIIFKNIFKQYSSFGFMSKKQCLKYHQRCLGGEVTSHGQTKVDKIFDQYDKDKDGYLTEDDFIAFYQYSSRVKDHSVWNNLQSFGVRNDLQILDNIPISYPDKDRLARTKLFQNQKFMQILLRLLGSPEASLAKSAWSLLARLPLYTGIDLELDTKKEYLTRYWLYLVENKKEFQKITADILVSILGLSIQTACIGLKIAYECNEIDASVFEIITENLQKTTSIAQMSFFSKVTQDYCLKVFKKFVIGDEKISNHYISKSELINKIFREGIMSKNVFSREIFCNTITELLQESVSKQFKLFQTLFNLVYRIFDNCDLSTLTMQYFQLFSHLLTILKEHNQLMPKLGLNWGQLTQEIIQIYKTHECTETSLTSKPDQVAEGLLKIITKLLNTDTIQYIVNLVPYIFQQSLFPQKGRNKLKTSKSRQDAYELIFQICNFKGIDGKLSGGLQKLFEAGFKDIYKKMSSKKSSETFSYYYYSYNQSRSELGYAGIRNLGCICYMIAMLQQLYMTSPFRNLILMADDGEPQCLVKKGNKQIDDNIFHQLKTMFGYLLLTEKQQYNPQQFCFAFKDFEGQPVNTSVQQDAQEFINIFFDKLETSLKGTPFKHIFQNVFGGKTCSQTTCSGCGAIKQRSQNFYPLSLQIKGYKNINESLNKYITGEVISDYQCDSCKNKCDVTKRSFLQKTPNYFIIHLQRMCFNYDRLENEKVNSRWQFPQDLSVYNYTLAKQKGIPQANHEFTYKLKGIVLHYGTADFGHYFSYIKESENQWIQFNDQRVREFDPSDIQLQCFGGQGWRRESQSAYLLVYERQQKSDVILQFSNEQEKKKILQQYKLMNSIKQENKQSKNPSDSQISKVDSIAEQMNEEKDKQKQKELDKENTENSGVKVQDKKILVHLDLNKINQFVPKAIKDKIDQENDDFSFTMNLSNNQFATFIHNILSINPPEKLKEEFLELCYQCLNLRQTIKDSQNKTISISEWATERFTELIEGHGWQFMKSYAQNWDGDILNIQKNTRTVTKCLLNCAVNDIIKTNNFNSQLQEISESQDETRQSKRSAVLRFLDKLNEMMLNEVVKHWLRFAEYFELWINLINQNIFVRRYCQEKMIVEKILDFVIEKKRPSMGNQYYGAQFEYPLSMMNALLNHGYELNQMEEKCLRTYGFMDKLISHRVQGANLIETLCKDNSIISQKMGYLLLNNCTQVGQSDQVKPIISSIHQYLKIDDDLKKQRLQWIIGFPTYVEHVREKGFGSYGCIPVSDSAINYLSALGTSPILQQIMKFKKKTQHVTALLISMILQLQSDGYINNLEEYPGKMALDKSYTMQFEPFVNKYYEQTQRPYTGKVYIQYGERLKRLWDNRPNRPLINPYPKILLGKTIEQILVKEQTVQQIYEIRQYNIKCHYLPLNNEGSNTLTLKNLVTAKNNQNFVSSHIPTKMTKTFGHYNAHSFIRGTSSDDEQTEVTPSQTAFEQSGEGWLLRKIEIINKSSEDMLSVFGVADENECNLHVPISPLSVQIQSQSKSSLILIKKNINEDYGDLNIVFNILGKATSAGYMPRQIITEVDQKVESKKENSSQEEDDDQNQN